MSSTDNDGLLDLGSLAHIERGDLRSPQVSEGPLIGLHNAEADARATAVYFRKKPETATEKAVCDLVYLATEKQKRMDAIREIAEIGQDLGIYDNGFRTEDSGQREEFSTGSRRDTREGKGRYDLLPPLAIQRLALVYEKGGKRYGDRNWEKGQPLSRYLDSALRHLFQVLEGNDDEDHAGHAAWNVLALIATQEWIRRGELPVELGDL